MLLEQAESRLTHGPVRLKNQLSRAASNETFKPIEECLGSVSESLETMMR